MALKNFIKKWDILEYLGEDRKNVRLIDRMLAKGEIVRWEWWEYMLAKDVIKEAMILLQITDKEVENRSDELEKLREQLREANESLDNLNNAYIQLEEKEKKSSSKLEELIEMWVIQRGC